jgi:hypothetical protein
MKLDTQLKLARTELAQAKSKVESARQVLAREMEDVDQLERFSFKNMLMTLTGRKKKYTQEQVQEYLQAGLELEDQQDDLDFWDAKIRSLETDLKNADGDSDTADAGSWLGRNSARDLEYWKQAAAKGADADQALRALAKQIVTAFEENEPVRFFGFNFSSREEAAVNEVVGKAVIAKRKLREFLDFLPDSDSDATQKLNFDFKTSLFSKVFENFISDISMRANLKDAHAQVVEVGKALAYAQEQVYHQAKAVSHG